MTIPVQITFDCADPDRLAHFWADLLGYQLDPPPPGYDSWEAWLTEQGVPEADWNMASAVSDPEGARAPHLLPARSRAEGAEEQGPPRRERRRTSRHAR